MSSYSLLAIANLLFLEVLVRYFELTKYELKEEKTHFYFTELNEIPVDFKDVKLGSKGFFPEATVQVFLYVARVYCYT